MVRSSLGVGGGVGGRGEKGDDSAKTSGAMGFFGPPAAGLRMTEGGVGEGAKRLRRLGRLRTLFWVEARGLIEDVEDRLGDKHAVAAGGTDLR